MSQSLQLSQLPRLCMPLVKFSYANLHANNSGPIPWTHLTSRDDLFVLMDPIEQPERRYQFKVLQDPNAHEDFDLTLLARGAQQAMSEARASPIPGQQPSITVLVKTPCVAIRYPRQDGQIRRFQIRFAREEDFYETLKVFSSMKVPFIEAGGVPSQPTSLNPCSTTAHNHQEQMSNVLNAPKFNQIQTHASTRTERESCGPFLASNKPGFAVDHPGTLSYTRPFSISQPDLSTMQTCMNDRPLTASPYFQSFQTNPGTATSIGYQGFPAAGPSVSSISTYIPRPSTAPVTGVHNTNSTLPPRRELPFTRKAKPISGIVGINEDGARYTITHDNITAGGVTPELPMLAPPVFSAEAPIEKSKKKSTAKPRKPAVPRKSRAAPKPSKPSTDTRNNDPPNDCVQSQRDCLVENAQIDTQLLLEKATAIQARKNKALIGDDQMHAASTSEGQEHTSLNSTTADWQTTSRAPPLQSGAQNANNEHQESSYISTATVAPLSFATKSNSEQFSKTNQHNSDLNLNHEARQQTAEPISNQQPVQSQPEPESQQQQQPTDTTSPPLPSLPTEHAFDLRALLTDPTFALPVTIPSSSTDQEAPNIKFGDLPTDQQHDVLEKFIIQSLHDKEFVQLCKTLEGVWQRVFVEI